MLNLKYLTRLGLTEELMTEINDYFHFIQDPIRCRKSNIVCREITVNRQNIPNIAKFLEYLAENNHKITHIKSLKNYLEEYFIPYCETVYRQHPTSTFSKRTTGLLVMIENYYKIKNNNIRKEWSEINALPIKAGKYIGQLESKKKVKLENIICLLDHPKMETKLIFHILMKLGWRSNNIRNMRLGINLIKKEDNWYYHFEPEEQKCPITINGIRYPIDGKIPDSLMNILEDYLLKNKVEEGNYIFGGFKSWSPSWLNTYVKKACRENNLPEVSPHSFRTIIPSAFNAFMMDKNETMVEYWQWHKLKLSANTWNYNRFCDKLDRAVTVISGFVDDIYKTKVLI